MAGSQDHVVAILGCGKMGVSIIRGLLASDTDAESSGGSQPQKPRLRLIACVRRAESASQLRRVFPKETAPVIIVTDGNVEAARKAHVVVLGCKPDALYHVLGAPGMREALDRKPLISILVGSTTAQVRDALDSCPRAASAADISGPHIICAVPSIASAVGRSMTVVSPSTPTPTSTEALNLASDMLARLGWVAQVPAEQMDISTVLCAAGPAYISLVLEALADAAASRGVPRTSALQLAARTLQGTAELVLRGESPAGVREKVCTPGGCSARGLEVLERGHVSSIITEAVQEAERAVSGLLARH